MPTITINGKVCEFTGTPSILQVALENDIQIPHYCWHEGLSVVASCRICLGEVWAPNPRNENRLEPIPRLLPTCQTPCGDGQVVYTNSPRAIANQKAVMEYLLIHHPLDCPICDQAGECYLQDYSYEYGRGQSRFEETKIKQPKKDMGPTIWLYADRCIMCSRCVRFTREVTGTGEICVTGRGDQEQIDLFPGKALNNPLSGNVGDICPVGALLDKDFLFTQRVWLLTQTPSIDGLTCSGDNISIEHNEGRIYRVKPRRNLEVNKWWISDEIRYGWKFIHRDDRLSEPRRVQYGERVTTSWAQAYKEVDEALRAVKQQGGRIAALVSPMLPCEEAYLIAKFVRRWHNDPSAAILGIGPIPTNGEDQTFPSGAKPTDRNAYTIYAEKAPNARGVRRILGALRADQRAGPSSAPAGLEDEPARALEFDAWLKAVKDADAVILTGNYPSDWVTPDLTKALAKKFVVLIDTLPTPLVDKADVVLPSCSWAEKSGTFENVNHRLQAFEQALQPLEGTKSEGQIFTDLSHFADTGRDGQFAPRYNPTAVRAELADALGLTEFATEVHMPMPAHPTEEEMVMVDL